MENIKEQIEEILNELHPEVTSWEEQKEMVHSGLLNSLDIVTLIGELSDKFDIEIPPSEIIYENFDTLQGLISMVEKLSD